MSLRIGTSGWHYPSGRGTWNGIFYPEGRDRGRGFDELTFYADRFKTVEINATFYGQPRASVSESWVRRTPPGFDFAVKLYQKFTHPKMFRDAALAKAPGSEGALLDLLSQVTQSDIDEFRTGIDPLVNAGRLATGRRHHTLVPDQLHIHGVLSLRGWLTGRGWALPVLPLALAAAGALAGAGYLFALKSLVLTRSVSGAGRTLHEVRACIEQHLAAYLQDPEINGDVLSYNSKVVYVITDGGGYGEQVVRLPVTGNETVLDAVSQIDGLSQVSSKRIWVARPAPAGTECAQVLDVHWRDYHWPAFNVADSAITVGVILLATEFALGDRRRPDPTAAAR